MELKYHQRFVVDFMKNNDQKGIIIYHGLGSGKTITSIAISQIFGFKTICIVPASMRTQWKKELEKMKVDIDNYDIMSYEAFYKEILKNSSLLNNKTIIIDEAHRLRNALSIKSYFMDKYIENANKVILLTGTPMVNSPHDVSFLLNMITKKNFMPINEQDFDYQFRNPEDFKNKIKNLFSYYKPDDLSIDYPTVNKVIKGINMKGNQLKIYKNLTMGLTDHEREMIRHGNILIKNKHFNSFLNVTRQLSNIVKGEVSSNKLEHILKYVKYGPKPSIIYSNWLESGIFPMSYLLSTHNINHLTFTGELNDKQKKNIVDRYNNKQKKEIHLSSTEGEG